MDSSALAFAYGLPRTTIPDETAAYGRLLVLPAFCRSSPTFEVNPLRAWFVSLVGFGVYVRAVRGGS